MVRKLQFIEFWCSQSTVINIESDSGIPFETVIREIQGVPMFPVNNICFTTMDLMDNQCPLEFDRIWCALLRKIALLKQCLYFQTRKKILFLICLHKKKLLVSNHWRRLKEIRYRQKHRRLSWRYNTGTRRECYDFWQVNFPCDFTFQIPQKREITHNTNGPIILTNEDQTSNWEMACGSIQLDINFPVKVPYGSTEQLGAFNHRFYMICIPNCAFLHSKCFHKNPLTLGLILHPTPTTQLWNMKFYS